MTININSRTPRHYPPWERDKGEKEKIYFVRAYCHFVHVFTHGSRIRYVSWSTCFYLSLPITVVHGPVYCMMIQYIALKLDWFLLYSCLGINSPISIRDCYRSDSQVSISCRNLCAIWPFQLRFWHVVSRIFWVHTFATTSTTLRTIPLILFCFSRIVPWKELFRYVVFYLSL